MNSEGFKVIPAFTGHGIGSYFHGPPDIYPCRLVTAFRYSNFLDMIMV